MRVACLAIGLLLPVAAGAEVLYRLPWPEGLSFMFTQAPGGRITSHFTKSTLYAVDIAMPEGIPVLAARAGVVEGVDASHGTSPAEDPLTYEGNFVRVRHGDGTAALYAHLRHRGVSVGVGETVAPGHLLGYSGSTGDVLYPQLHFAVLRVSQDSWGGREEVSIPVRFYVGVPSVVFSPRSALRVTSNYSGPATLPRAPSEGDPLVAWHPLAPEASDEADGWRLLGIWLACGVAALAWFWRFSRE